MSDPSRFPEIQLYSGWGEPMRTERTTDALNLAAGPIVTVKLPVRVRSTFHGYWVPEATLETGLYLYTLRAA